MTVFCEKRKHKKKYLSSCSLSLIRLKFFQLTNSLSTAKNDRKLILHKSTTTMMISFATFPLISAC
eukprot:UN19916